MSYKSVDIDSKHYLQAYHRYLIFLKSFLKGFRMEMASKLTLTFSLEKNENKDIKFLWKHRVFFNFIYDLDKSILTFAVSCNFHLCLELYNKIFCRVWFLQPFAVVSQPQVIRCFLLPLKSSTQKIAIKKIAAKKSLFGMLS